MDDGKSIRYKDLYALFEQILEKTMRLEQRDWSESPVKVWVNTFKVFLDEYMLEYKPLDCTAVKVASIFSRSFKICELSFCGAVLYADTLKSVVFSPFVSWGGRHKPAQEEE